MKAMAKPTQRVLLRARDAAREVAGSQPVVAGVTVPPSLRGGGPAGAGARLPAMPLLPAGSGFMGQGLLMWRIAISWVFAKQQRLTSRSGISGGRQGLQIKMQVPFLLTFHLPGSHLLWCSPLFPGDRNPLLP